LNETRLISIRVGLLNEIKRTINKNKHKKREQKRGPTPPFLFGKTGYQGGFSLPSPHATTREEEKEREGGRRGKREEKMGVKVAEGDHRR